MNMTIFQYSVYMCEMSIYLLNFNFLSCLNLRFTSHSLKIKTFLAFSEINQELYLFFILVRLSYVLNSEFPFCFITDKNTPY